MVGSPMVRLKCPNCANVIDAPAGTTPRCPACGFVGGATPGLAQAAPGTPFSPVETAPSLRPGWVTMTAVFQFIGGGFNILFGLIVAIAGGAVLGAIDHPVADILGGVAAVVGIVIIAWGAFQVLLGSQNLRGREWARVFSIVLAGIGAALDVFTLAVGNVFALFSLTIEVLIIVGLCLRPTRLWYAQQSQRGAAVYTTA